VAICLQRGANDLQMIQLMATATQSSSQSPASLKSSKVIHFASADTVNPFNLAALKVDDFACKIILRTFLFWRIQAAHVQHTSNAN